MEINLSTLLFIVKAPKRLEDPNPWIGHIPFSFFITKLLKPQIIVELGTHSGNSFLSFVQAANELNLNTKCYAIDTWQGDPMAGFYDESIYSKLQKYINTNFNDSTVLIRKSFDEAVLEFEDNSIDLLHIDGMHTYNDVKHDFEMWKSKVSDNGIILFHDTNVLTEGFGVYKLWKELKNDYPNIEFKHSNGLGVLIYGKDIIPKLLEFVDDFNNNTEYIKLFEMLGENINNLFMLQVQNEKIQNIENELKTKLISNKNIVIYHIVKLVRQLKMRILSIHLK